MSGPTLLETLQRNSGSGSPRRLAVLDGLRALAIGWVVAYHYFYFWTPAGKGTPLLAYGDAYANLPFVPIGYLGVHLFFVISGFVILMTLERTRSLKEFLLRRAIRLWPALLLFGTATFLIVGFFGPHELHVGWREYLLSLFVLPPQHVAMLVGAHDWQWLDGAYWSLWVEIKFYCVLGALFFAFRRNVIGAWIVYELLTLVIGVLSFALGGKPLHMLDGFLFAPYVPYFAFGLAAYWVWSERNTKAVRLLTAFALVHIVLVSAMQLAQMPELTASRMLEFIVGQAAIFLLFYLFAWRKAELSFFCWWPLAHVGRASYGVYLLHQNIGVTLLSAPIFAAAAPSLLGPVLAFSAFVAIALFVFDRIEVPLQSWLKQSLIADSGRREQHQRAAVEASPTSVRPLA